MISGMDFIVISGKLKAIAVILTKTKEDLIFVLDV